MIIRTDNHVEAYRQRALHMPEYMSGRAAKATHDTNLYISGVIGNPPELLDVGCGDGSLLVFVGAPKSAGITPTESERDILSKRHPGVSFLCGTAQQIPLADKAFDTVVCNAVLLLLASQAELVTALQELRRVARRQLFVGELPYKPETFNHDVSSPGHFVTSNFKKSLRHGLSALKILTLAAVGRQTFITEPNQLIWGAREFVETTLGRSAAYMGEHSPGRHDYLFRFD